MARFFLLSLLAILIAVTTGYSIDFNRNAFDGIEGLADIEDALFKAINEERLANGLTVLKRDRNLDGAARQHSHEMKDLFYFDHESPTPGLKDVRDRVYAAGLTDLVVAENLATENRQRPGEVAADEIGSTLARMFMNSDKHRANILDPRFTHTGVGCTVSDEGTLFCTQVFSSKILAFKSLKIKEKTEETLSLTLKLKFDDEVGVWIDEKDVYVFQPKDGVVEIKILFPIAKGARRVAMARRVPGTFGPMTGFFIGRFDPREPFKFSNAITDIDIVDEIQERTSVTYYVIEAKGEAGAPVAELRVADGDNRFGVKMSKTDFEAVYGIPANTGRHMILFVTGDESCHGIRVDTNAPLENAFAQGRPN
jgi:uncharacterized protein YkwD